MFTRHLRVHLLDRRGVLWKKMWQKSVYQYTQGQSPEPKTREYFYYIDHQGMVFSVPQTPHPFAISHKKLLLRLLQLFLDDARMKNFTSCFKDKKFLAFFFKRLKRNTTDRYSEDFPYLSLCGVERNFVRCDDLPIVFTKIIQRVNGTTGTEEDWFSYAYAEELTVPFEPQKILMRLSSGRVYHPAPEKVGGIGLVASKIAIELSRFFQFNKGEDHPPTHFLWRNKIHVLDSEWYRDKLTSDIINI